MSKLVDTDFELQRLRLRQHFECMATRADEPNPIYALMGERLLERLDGLRLTPQRILELGSGFGWHAQALHHAFPKAQVIAMDWALGMAKQASKRRRWWRKPFEVVVGDIEHPPVASGSMDLVFANASLMYGQDPHHWLRCLRRLLKPGGFLLLSSLGRDTLLQQRQTLGAREPALFDVQGLAALLTQAGFNEPVLDADWLDVRYASAQRLRDDLEQLGLLAHGVLGLNHQTDFGPLGLDHPQALETTWECIYASAFAPEVGQTLKEDAGTVASVPVADIGIRRRQ